MREHWRHHRIHYIKGVVTIGCTVSAFIALLWPSMGFHAAVCTTVTNLIWIWEC